MVLVKALSSMNFSQKNRKFTVFCLINLAYIKTLYFKWKIRKQDIFGFLKRKYQLLQTVFCKTSFTVEVGYTGVKKEWCFKFLIGLPCIWCSMISWTFWHLFLMKSIEKWGSATQKTIFEVGGLRGVMKSAFLHNLMVSSAILRSFLGLDIWIWGQ